MRQYSRVGECVEFNGVRFYRYPDAKQRSHRTYFTPGIADRRRGVKALHQEVWKAAHGPIPEGHVIHHLDGDSTNNDLSNLGCLPNREHAGHHMSERNRTPEHLAHLAAVRASGAPYRWHQTEAGRQFHIEHGQAFWVNRQPVPSVCVHCGTAYECLHATDRPRFCSQRCVQAAAAQEGRYNVIRTCVVCGNEFTTNRHRKAKSCSPACAGRLVSATRIRLFEQGEITPSRRHIPAA